jgi:hypothetical protein
LKFLLETFQKVEDSLRNIKKQRSVLRNVQDFVRYLKGTIKYMQETHEN